MIHAFQNVVSYLCFAVLATIACVCVFVGFRQVGRWLRANLCPVSLLVFATAVVIATCEAQKRGNEAAGAPLPRGEYAVSVTPHSVGEAALLPLPGAETNAKWRAHGAFEDVFYLSSSNWWARMSGGGWIDRLRIRSSGGIQAKGASGGSWTNYPPPFAQKFSLAPEANWSLPSLFWHATTPSNTLVMTWVGGLYARSHTNQVDFQVELFNDGSYDYRYADHAERFPASLPFDLDGDGLENSVDPEPETAGPDAHGTNAEWYNTVCSNVLEAVTTSCDPPGGGSQLVASAELLWREGVNSNAYYFVDVVTERGPSPIYFTGDRESRLGNPVVVANAFETNRVPLLIGVDYSITSDTPFTVSFPVDYMSPTVQTNTPCTASIRWPLNFIFTESIGASNRVYTVTVEPYDPGGVLEWNDTGGGVPMRGSVLNNGCECVHYGINSVWFTCSTFCTCDGVCYAEGTYALELAAFPVEGGQCRCGFDDPPPDSLPSSHEPDDPPSLTITFSKPAVIFEEAYEDEPGVTMPRRSTRVRLAIDAYGGAQGGALWLTGSNMGKLTAITGGVSLPHSQNLAAGQSYHASGVYEGLEPSDFLGDVGAFGALTEIGTGHLVSDSNCVTVVKMVFTPDFLINNSEHRHVIGVNERAQCTWVPVTANVDVTAVSGTTSEVFGNRYYRAPLVGAIPNLIAHIGDVSYNLCIRVLEPNGVIARNPVAYDYGIPTNEAGGAGMELTLTILPTNVSFMGIAVQEVPSDYRDPQGYFTNQYFDFAWSHTTNRGAGVWHNIQPENFFMLDNAEMGDWLPRMKPNGETTEDTRYGWFDGTMNWLIPVGWNERGADEADVPVKTFTTYWQSFSMTSEGTLKVQKLKHYVERGTNSVVRLNGAVQLPKDLRPR